MNCFFCNNNYSRALELFYFLALLALLQSSSLQMVEYCESISLGIETVSVSPVPSCPQLLWPVANI